MFCTSRGDVLDPLRCLFKEISSCPDFGVGIIANSCDAFPIIGVKCCFGEGVIAGNLNPCAFEPYANIFIEKDEEPDGVGRSDQRPIAIALKPFGAPNNERWRTVR